MGLWNKRVLFTKLLGEFICEAVARGYKIAIDDAKATSGHMANSLHYVGLAVDFVLYTDEGDYLKDTKDYKELGRIWDSIHEDCSWGGDFNDGGHFSLRHDGLR